MYRTLNLGATIIIVLSVIACNKRQAIPPKDSDGTAYKFLCEKHAKCNDQLAVIVIAINSTNSEEEKFVLCCDTLKQTIDTLNDWSKKIDDINKKLKDKEFTDEEGSAENEKIARALIAGNDKVEITMKIHWLLKEEKKTKGEVKIDIRHQGTSNKATLSFTKKDLDKFIKLLDENFKNCCI